MKTRRNASSPVSPFTVLVRKGFAFLLARAHCSRAAAFGAALVALAFSRRLMTPLRRDDATSGRIFEGEFRRVDETAGRR